jgi:hypothetical protein
MENIKQIKKFNFWASVFHTAWQVGLRYVLDNKRFMTLEIWVIF